MTLEDTMKKSNSSLMDLESLGISISKDALYKALLRECYEHAKKSKHPTTHNAALLVKDGKIVLKGVNNLPPGVKEKKEFYEGDNRHIYPNHAERDVMYQAARKGIKTDGLTMVMPWLPCIPCMNAVISGGIKELVVHKQMVERTREGWRDELIKAVEIMQGAGIDIRAYDGEVGSKAYMHSQEWDA